MRLARSSRDDTTRAECGWEDEPDDLNADEVRGGPNGSESLTAARLRYAEYAAHTRSGDRQSVTQGGDGAWWGAARQAPRGTAEADE
ncbi:CPCC family cysteine-rich protein [Streptomyces sp. NPDC002078]